MAWTKGAVVIVKRGDEEWADSIEKTLTVDEGWADSKEIEQLKSENEELKRDKAMTKIHDTRFTNAAIDSLSNKHDYYLPPPRWIRIIKEGIAFIVYWVSIFVDKYMVIK